MHALADEFLRRGCRVTVFTALDGVDKAGQFEAAGIRILTHPNVLSRKPLSLLDPLLCAYYLAKLHRNRASGDAPDLVLCFSYMYALAAKRAWPHAQVCYLAGAAAWDWHGCLYGNRSRTARAVLMVRRLAALWAERKALRTVDKVIVESEFLRGRLEHFHRGVGKKIVILPAPVDTDRFRPALERREKIRRELLIPDHATVILGVGRLDSRKNYAPLVEAVSLLDGDWRLVIVGSGTEEASLRALVSQHNLRDRVRFLGARTDVESVCSMADIYVHPSLVESCVCNAVLEAMASGLPCIVSKRVSFDLIDGQDALLADACDPADLAAKITQLMTDKDLAAHLGRQARRYCEQRQGWPGIADRLIAEFPVSRPRGATA